MFAINPLSKQVPQAPVEACMATVADDSKLVSPLYSNSDVVSYHSIVLVTIWVCKGLVRKECSYRPQTLKNPLPRAEALMLVVQLPTRSRCVSRVSCMLADRGLEEASPNNFHLYGAVSTLQQLCIV